MRRRELLKAALTGATLPALTAFRPAPVPRVMTVRGWIDAAAMGTTLAHEHLYADLRSFAEQQARPILPAPGAVERKLLPHLRALRAAGCATLVDATATHVGRSPALVRRLSIASGLHMLVPSGVYLSADGRFAPDYLATDSAEALAARWIGEWRNGIAGTEIRPGFLKLGVNGGPLRDAEAKAMRAAALTHRATGLTIAVHTGPWRTPAPGENGQSAQAQLALLRDAGVAPSAWIWFHAQNEADGAQHLAAARQGAYVSFDGYRPGMEAEYAARIDALRREGLLDRVLVSQDAGWYTAGAPNGGDFSPYAPILTRLVPALRGRGFDAGAIATLFRRNPAAAYAVRVRSA